MQYKLLIKQTDVVLLLKAIFSGSVTVVKDLHSKDVTTENPTQQKYSVLLIGCYGNIFISVIWK